MIDTQKNDLFFIYETITNFGNWAWGGTYNVICSIIHSKLILEFWRGASEIE